MQQSKESSACGCCTITGAWGSSLRRLSFSNGDARILNKGKSTLKRNVVKFEIVTKSPLRLETNPIY